MDGQVHIEKFLLLSPLLLLHLLLEMHTEEACKVLEEQQVFLHEGVEIAWGQHRGSTGAAQGTFDSTPCGQKSR